MKTKRYLSRLVSMLLVCSMLVSMIPVMVLPASAAEQGKVLEDVTLPAEPTTSTNRTVSGTGNKVLTFTAAITDPDKTLKANIKMYRDPGEGEGTSKIEVLRFKLDRGDIKLSDLSKPEGSSSINYSTMAPYADGETYSLKLVLRPATGEVPATVQLFQVDGQTETQLGEDLQMPNGVTLEELTRLSFAVDSNSGANASVTFSNMVYATGVDLGGGETPEEPGDETVVFSQDFEGEVTYQGDHSGSDVAEPSATGETSKVLELTDLDSSTAKAVFKFDEPQSGKVTVTFKMKVLEDLQVAGANIKSVINFVCGSSAVSGNYANASAGQILRLATTGASNYRLQFRGGDASTYTYQGKNNYIVDQWHTVKVALDTDAGKFSVSVDDRSLGETTLGYSTTGLALDQIDNIAFLSNGNSAYAHAYIDDIKVTVQQTTPPSEPTTTPTATPSSEPSSEPTATPTATPPSEPSSEPSATPAPSLPEARLVATGASFSRNYNVSGTGNKALSFTVTPAAEGTLKAGVKFSSDVSGSTTEVLRFKMENGKFRVKEPASSGYTVLGDYTAGQTCDLKLYLIPASGSDAAQFKLYQVQGSRETLVEAYTLTENTEGAKLEEITRVNFFTDSSNTGTATYADIDYATGVELPAEGPQPAATEYWVPPQNDGENFTLAEESVVATLPTSKITMSMGAGDFQVKAPTNGKPVSLGGVSYTKYLNGLSGNSPKPEQNRGEYFKFTVPAEVSAGELGIAYRLNAGKVLRVLVDGESMEGFDQPEAPTVNTDTVLKLSVEGGKTYLVYVESSMPYFYGFSFRPVDKEADMALFRDEIASLGFDWIRGENTSATAVDRDLVLDTSYLSSFGMCDVTWTSSSVAVDGSGKVNRLAVDTPVTLTANISVQQISYLNLNQDFTVTVRALADDTEAVTGAKTALTLGSTTAVKKDLVLPAQGMHGTTVTWSSSDPAVVTVDAANGLGVIHPNDTETQTVTLTATISRGSVTQTKDFVVTVAIAKIMDVNSWAYTTASGETYFTPVDGGKLKSINVTNNNQHLDTDDYKFKVEVLKADGTVKYTSAEYTASAFFTHGAGVSEHLELNTSMDATDTFRVTAYDAQKTYVTVTHGAADNTVAPGAKLFVIGDSTAAVYADKKYPQKGWAQVLEPFFDGVTVVDLALPGRSSLDFKTKPNFETLKNQIGPGDYLIIQFGHNDSHTADASIYTDPALDRFSDGAAPSYKRNMAEYVTLAWDAGAYPIIATSISRRKLDDNVGQLYGDAARALAEELSIPCVDVLNLSNGWINKVGLTESIDMFLTVKPQDSRFYNAPEYNEQSEFWAGNVSKPDDTHVNINGASLIAMFAADGIKDLGIPLGAKRSAKVVSETLPHYADAISGPPLSDELTPAKVGTIDFVGDGWKLQLPVEDPNKTGSILEKTPTELAAGYTDEYFYADTDAQGVNAVVFHTPVDGFKTANTSYARSELREMLDPTDKAVNWTWEGTHTLVTEQAVTHVPASGKTITSQIHGIEQNGDNANPLVKVRYVYDSAIATGKVVVEIKKTTAAGSDDFKYEFPNVALGQKYKTTIQVKGGVASVTIATTENGTERSETFTQDFVSVDENWKNTWYYYKVGNYIQDNADTGADAYADVWVYSARTSHLRPGEDQPLPPLPESVTVTAAQESVSNKYALSGTGNKILTFTVTPSATTSRLNGGFKFFADGRVGREEVLRFKMDTSGNDASKGSFKISEVINSSTSYVNLGNYDAGSTYTLKLVMIPATGTEKAKVRVYQVEGEALTQLGGDYVLTTADLNELTVVDLFTDSRSDGTLSYTNVSYEANATIPGTGDDPTPGSTLPATITVTAGEATTTSKYAVTTGQGNTALSFAVTASATDDLSGGVKFYSGGAEMIRFKLDKGVFKLGEFGKDASGTTVQIGSYAILGNYQANQTYYIKLVLVPAADGEPARVYALLDDNVQGSLALTEGDPTTIDDLRYFTDSKRSGTLTFTGNTYESGVDFDQGGDTPDRSNDLFQTPEAWTLGESASISDGKLTITAGEVSSSNRIDVSGDGVKTLSFDVALSTDSIKALKGGVNFRDAAGNTVLRFKMQNGHFRLSDLKTDSDGKTIYTDIDGRFAEEDSFSIKLEIFPATDRSKAKVQVYQNGEIICDGYTLEGDDAATLADITRLYFFTDSNSAGTYVYSNAFYTTGPKVPAHVSATGIYAGNWALRLPTEDASNPGLPMEKTPVQLMEGYFDSNFFADMDDLGADAVVFRTPVGSQGANRLKEATVPSAGAQEWDKHTLISWQRVTELPSDGQVIFAQALAQDGSVAALLRYDYDSAAGTGNIVAVIQDTEQVLGRAALGEAFQTTLQLRNGAAQVTLHTTDANGRPRPITWSYPVAQTNNALPFTFAVGSMLPSASAARAVESAEVWLYSASIEHTPRYTHTSGGGGNGTSFSDGSTVTEQTDKSGAVTITRTAANGDTIQAVQQPDGSVRITTQTGSGTSVIDVDAAGKAQAKVEISELAADRARQNGEILTLPMPQLTPGKDLDSAPTVEIVRSANGELLAKMPCQKPSAGTVLVAVHADGTQELVRMSVPTQDGMLFKLSGSVTVKLVDHARKFDDVSTDHWAAEAIDFASGRELLVGTAENLFSPNGTTTRAMVVTILARLDGADTAGGETWYSKGMDWAVAQSVSDGTNPEALISREQFVTMLYRYAGQPSVSGSALGGFADGAAVSSWAAQAMQWAVANGIMRGRTDGTLDPAGTTTRAEAATFLMRYCKWALGVPLEISVPSTKTDTVVAFENDFDDEQLGKQWTQGAQVVDLDGKWVVEISDSNTAKSVALNFTFPAQSGEVAISFKLYVDPEAPDSVIVLTAGNTQSGKYSSNSAGEFLRLKTVPGSRKFQFRGGDSTKTSSNSGGSYQCGAWTDLEVIVDTDTKTFSVYANGELLGKNQPMSSKINAAMNGIDNITFMTEKEGVGRVYIDDVKVTRTTRGFYVWDEAVEDYMPVSGGGTGLLKDITQWNLKQGEIRGGILTVTAGEDSASNKIAVSGKGNKELTFTVASDNEGGAKGGVRFVSEDNEILRFKLDGGKFKISDMRTSDTGKTSYATLGSYNEDTAYEVRILCLEKTASRAACIKVYVDGKQLGDTYTLSDTVAASMENITELNFFTDKGCEGTLTYSDMAYRTGADVEEVEETAPEEVNVDLSQSPAGTGAIDFLKDGWKLQIPVENPAKAGSVKELSPAELAQGYTDEFIYAAKDEDGTPAVVFHSPVKGFKTGNTSYARSELRELLDPSDSKVNWTWQGTHILETEERVTHVPASGQTITSQIHGIEQNGDNANPLVKVRYVYNAAKGTGAVRVELKDTTSPTSYDYKYDFPNVALGQKYKTQIHVFDGTACVTISTTDPDGTQRSETYRHDFVNADPYWKETWYYFKLGNYIQDNKDDSDDAYADVWVYSSSITHSDMVDKVPVSSIDIDQSDVSIRSGERTSLTTTASPVKAYDKSVTWSVTQGSDVAAVDKDGFVTGIKEGTATITATSVSDPAATDTITVTVKDVAVVEVKPIFARDFGTDGSKTDPADYGGEDVEITTDAPAGTSVAVAHEGGNDVVTLRDDSSSAPAKLSFVFAPQTTTTTIAFKVRVDALGEHTAGKGDFGRLYIVAAGSDEWYTDENELFRIRNTASGTLGSFSELSYLLTDRYIEPSTNADKIVGGYGDWVDVIYVVTPNNGTAKANTTDVYMNGYPVALAVANRNSVDYVNRLDIQTGSADQLTFSVDDVRVYTGIMLPENTELVRPAALRVAGLPSVMAVRDWAQASVETTPIQAYDKVAYSVISGDAVCVSDDGYVTAVKEGTAVIRAESVLDSSVFAQATVAVQDSVIRPTAISAPATVHVVPGGSERLAVTVLPANATEKGVRYELVSGGDAAAVNGDGVVTGKAVGSATIRVSCVSDPAVFTTVSVSVTQTLRDGEVIFADSFDAGELNSANWSVSLAKDNTFVRMEEGAMTFIDANTAANPKVTLDFAPASGKVSIQFKIKVEGEVTIQGGTAKSTGYRNLRIAFGSGNITATANESFCIRSNGTYFTYNTSGSTYVEMPGDYNIAEWNEVTLVTTINTAGADTTDVYVNGVKVLAGAPNKVDYPAIDKLCFSADTANVAAFTVDDLGIWAGDLSDKPADMYAKRFSDVPAGHWAQEAISYASGKGLLNGIGNGAFDPEATTTRATLVTILARLDGVDTNGGETWYSKGTDWAVSKGISDGTAPDGPISREQFVTMLYRYAGRPAAAGNTLNGFADGQTVSDWAIPAVEWAVASGLMTGRTDGTLDPAGTTTRAEAAVLLMRYCQQSEAGR